MNDGFRVSWINAKADQIAGASAEARKRQGVVDIINRFARIKNNCGCLNYKL